MRDAVALHRLEDATGVLLRIELGGVHADHHQRIVAVPLLEIAQHRQDVQAVDAAVGPEVEDDDLPAKVADRRWTVDVQPGRRSAEVRGVDPLAHGAPCKSPGERSGKQFRQPRSRRRDLRRMRRR